MSFFLSHDGVRIAYRVDGPADAPTLVLLNSIGTNMHMWDQQVARLNTTLRIVRYDCRGHGDSDAPAGEYTIEQLGLDLLALLDTLQIEQTQLCGLSLGGMIALWFTITYPTRVTRAVFANTAARIGTVERWNERIDAVKTNGMAAIRDASLTRFLSADFRQRNPEMTQQIGEMIEATPTTGYSGACAVLRDTDLRELVSTIHIPALILAGELDTSTPPSQARELHAALTGSQIHTFADVAHLSNVERPIEFSNYLQTFLAHIDHS